MTLSCAITPDLVAAYCLCKRKSFLLLRGDTGEPPHEYIRLLNAHAANRLSTYLDSLKAAGLQVQQDQKGGIAPKADVLVNVPLRAGDIEATVDALVCISPHSSRAQRHYEPHLVLGSHAITKEHKVRLAFIGYALSEAHRYPLATGTIVNGAGNTFRFQMPKLIAGLRPIIETIRAWKTNLPTAPPPITLNNHCTLCSFRMLCLVQAEKEDNLSLLDRMTFRLMQKYHKKGIFSVNQLSYLFKPRRQRRKRQHKPSGFNLELQVLALRTGKIYVHQPPSIPQHPTELFLDIEGVPDHGTHYLIGLIVSTQERVESHSLWADSPEDEPIIFAALLRIAEEHPEALIYHYGSYESKGLERVAKKYGLAVDSVRKRLINVNSFIFGKVYFPTRSNTLKDLGRLVGATWTSSDASGLQSVVWRFQWETSKSDVLKNQIIAYNFEDCQALRLLVAELRNIGQAAATRSDVDFADTPKQNTTPSGQHIHDLLEEILRSAHAEYRKYRIGVGQRKTETESVRRGPPKGHQGFRRIVPAKARKVIRVKRPSICPRHRGQALHLSDKVAEHTVIDLAFTRNGARKTITKYIGSMGHCRQCCRDYLPPGIRRLKGWLFGHGFRAWTVYQRISLRLPYSAIIQVIQDLFSEQITGGSIVNFIVDMAEKYASTEKILLKKILASPFIHIDETKMNIQGTNYYVWVLTDGIHVVFKLTETREATFVQEILEKGYSGVLISDFYAGYDSCKCRQQKCLVHLIRDLNDALWKNPFNSEFESFVSTFRDVLVPIMTDVNKYGLKRWHLNKHKQLVDRFYKHVILGRDYKCEVTQKYQKRFNRYRESLFRFLEEDGIPWNNNMAERASRHLAIQRKISGSFFKRVALQYLRLLGIAQTCRFQEKSFLSFLISKEKDIDQFKEPKRPKSSKLVGPAKCDREDPFEQEAREPIGGGGGEDETIPHKANEYFYP